jgi:hypothetical protein
MYFDPAVAGMRPPPFRHSGYNALVVPRPIGWISTISADGVVKVKPLARLGYMDYALIDRVFQMPRPD